METVKIIGRLELIRAALEAGDDINCSTIAAEHGISAKTAQRDINLLRRHFGLQIRYDERRKILYLGRKGK